MAYIIAQYANKASSQSPDIEVIDQYVLDMGNLRAFVKVRVGPWNACRVVQQRPFSYVQLPMAVAKRHGYIPVLTCAIGELDKQNSISVAHMEQAQSSIAPLVHVPCPSSPSNSTKKGG